jgi:hypothetical protein
MMEVAELFPKTENATSTPEVLVLTTYKNKINKISFQKKQN